MQSQNQAIIRPHFSFLAIIHRCKNVAIFLQGSCKNVRLLQGLILVLIRPCIRVTAAIFFGYQCKANVPLMLGLMSTSFGKTVILFVQISFMPCSCWGLIKAILLWEYLDKSVYCANTTDLSLKKRTKHHVQDNMSPAK